MRGDQRGSVSLEFAILTPVLVLLLGLVVGGARTWLARSAVDHMASASARAASQARTASAAENDARRLAAEQARLEGLRCEPLALRLDLAAVTAPAGTSGAVTVQVRCQVPLADLLVPGWPGSIRVEAEASSTVDRYRGR